MQPGQVRVFLDSFRTSSEAANKWVQDEFETMLDNFGMWDQPFEAQQLCDDEMTETEFVQIQNSCKKAMAPMLNSCRESLHRYNDFVFGESSPERQPAAAAIECDADAEAAEAAKRRAKRLRTDRKQGRR